MDPTAIEFTRSVLLVLGGALGVEIFKALRDGITGSMKRRRAEVDRIAREKADREDDIHALEAELREEETWARIVTEHAHTVRVIAIQAGLPVPDFPSRPPDRPST